MSRPTAAAFRAKSVECRKQITVAQKLYDLREFDRANDEMLAALEKGYGLLQDIATAMKEDRP